MSSNSTAAGGVRNLRAMFENKAGDSLSTSPPSRGRSPADSEVSAHSRPVSKVRASFVAVERPSEIGQGQQWGLRKTSDVSSMADAKTNGMGVGDSTQQQATKESGKEDQTAAFGHVSKVSLEGGLGTILKGSSFEPSTPEKTATGSAPKAKANGIEGTNGKQVPGNKNAPTAQGNKAASMIDKMTAAKDSGKPQPPPPTKLITTKTAQPIKPPPTRQVPSKPSVRSPVQPKTPKTPTTPASATKSSPKAKLPVTAPVPHTSKANEPKAPQPTKRMEEKDTRVNGTKKTSPTSPRLSIRPRSPLKTVRRGEPATKTESSQPMNGTKPKSPVETKPRTVNRPPRASGLPTSSTLHKKTSRASLPAQPSAHDRPKSRVSTTAKPADESFLARMMRPTASTAQKAHDKVQVNSPPRGNRNSSAPKARKSMGNLKTEDKENENEGQVISPVEKADEAALPAAAAHEVA